MTPSKMSPNTLYAWGVEESNRAAAEVRAKAAVALAARNEAAQKAREQRTKAEAAAAEAKGATVI